MNQEPSNPFTIGLLAEPAGRVEELERIARALSEPGGKLIVHGDRRLGKSATLECAAARVRERGHPVAIVDLSTASGPADAATRILSVVQNEIGRLTPDRSVPHVLDSIEAELNSRHATLGLGLDAFERFHEWGGLDAMKRHRAIAYVIVGSGRWDRARWKFADTLHFAPIDPAIMGAWIETRSEATGVPFDPSGAALIVALAGPRTRDIVQLARAVWDAADAEGERATEPDGVRCVFDRLVTEQGALLAKLWSSLTQPSQRVLRAVAAQPGAELTAAETIARYALGPKSTVYATARRLVDDEILADAMTFDDPFFRRWVERHALPDIGLAPPTL
jgi:hypothetical protein